MNRFLAIVACLHCVTALYSIGYYSRENGAVLVNGNAKYAQIPDAHQVADLYARLSGNAPLSNEGTCFVSIWFILLSCFLILRHFEPPQPR